MAQTGARATNHVERFRTHRNYLRAFALLTAPGLEQDPRRAYARLLARLQASGYIPKRPSLPQPAEARRSLQNAWSTELLLALTHEHLTDDEVVRLSNNWAAIQTYYILYHATQAVHV